MAHCAQGRVLVIVESAFVLQRSGIFQGSFVTVMTETATSTTVSFVQGMESVAVETVNAGMDGMETHVKSGLAPNILNDSTGDNWILISRPF